MSSCKALQQVRACGLVRRVTVFGSVQGFDVEEDEPLLTSQMFYTCEFYHQHVCDFSSITVHNKSGVHCGARSVEMLSGKTSLTDVVTFNRK